MTVTITITIITTINTITITISIVIAIQIVSLGLNLQTYAQNQWKVDCRFNRMILVGELLSLMSNCLYVLLDQQLDLLTLWLWDIVRDYCDRGAADNVQTMISTNGIISAIIPPATCLQQHPNPCPIIQWVSPFKLNIYCVHHGMNWKGYLKFTGKQARSIQSSAIRSILLTFPKVYLDAHSQIDREYTIMCNWQHTSKHTWVHTWNYLKCVQGSVKSSRLALYYQVHLEVSFRAYTEVDL